MPSAIDLNTNRLCSLDLLLATPDDLLDEIFDMLVYAFWILKHGPMVGINTPACQIGNVTFRSLHDVGRDKRRLRSIDVHGGHADRKFFSKPVKSAVDLTSPDTYALSSLKFNSPVRYQLPAIVRQRRAFASTYMAPSAHGEHIQLRNSRDPDRCQCLETQRTATVPEQTAKASS